MSCHCSGCGHSFKGSRGVAIHRGKTGCGQSNNVFSSSSSSVFSFGSSYSSPKLINNSIDCNNCGKQCKGQHGLAIHKAKSECGSSRSSYASSVYSDQSFNYVNCDNCGKQCKGQHGVAIHKAKSECGSSRSSYASSVYSDKSFNYINCDNCGKQCKGQHGLAIHKAKTECSSSKISSKDLSSISEFQNLNENSKLCDNCGGKFKGKKGLMIHKAKSRCGRITSQHTKNSIDICRHWLNDLKFEDLFNINYDHSIYDPGERIGFVEENIPDETTNSDVSKNLKSIYWPETDVVLNNKIDKEEQFYRDMINETIQNSDDWRMDLKTFKDRLQSAFKKDLYIDAEFIVIYESEEDKVLKGHKLIFALASPVFQAMFYGSLPEKDKVTIKDVSPRAMQNILLFLYTNSVIFNNIDDAFYTHYAAKKYILNNLQYRTVKYLEKNVNYENCFQIFEYSELMELNSLKDKCEIIMNKNPEKCLRSRYFLTMNLDSVMKIAAWYMERNIQNQLLAEKLVEWSMAECEMQEFHKTEENLISLLEPILDKFNSESFTDLISNLVRNSSIL